jgi:hypothetical protein
MDVPCAQLLRPETSSNWPTQCRKAIRFRYLLESFVRNTAYQDNGPSIKRCDTLPLVFMAGLHLYHILSRRLWGPLFLFPSRGGTGPIRANGILLFPGVTLLDC